MIMQPRNEDLVELVISAKPYQKKGKYKDMRRSVARQLIGLGVTQVIIGALCIVFNIVDIVMRYNLSFVGHGLWNGILFIVTGSFGIAGGIKMTECTVVTFHVLSIISSTFACTLFGTAIGSVEYSSTYFIYRQYYGYEPDTMQSPITTSMKLETLMAVLAVLIGITTIWAASLVCCQINCCRSCCVRSCCNCCVRGCCRCCCPAHQETKELVFTWASKYQQQPMITIKGQHQPMIMANSENMIITTAQQPIIMTPPQQTLISSGRQIVIYDPQVNGPYYIASSPDGRTQDPYTGPQNQESTDSETGPLGNTQLTNPYYTALSPVRKNQALPTGLYSQVIQGQEIAFT